MRFSSEHELVIPISQTLVDELARQVADKVAEQIGGQLRDERQRQVEARIEARVVEADPVEVTFLRLAEVSKRVGLSRSTIYTRMAAGTFPASVKLGARSVAWRRVDVEEWNRSNSAVVPLLVSNQLYGGHSPLLPAEAVARSLRYHL